MFLYGFLDTLIYVRLFLVASALAGGLLDVAELALLGEEAVLL